MDGATRGWVEGRLENTIDLFIEKIGADKMGPNKNDRSTLLHYCNFLVILIVD